MIGKDFIPEGVAIWRPAQVLIQLQHLSAALAPSVSAWRGRRLAGLPEGRAAAPDSTSPCCVPASSQQRSTNAKGGICYRDTILVQAIH